MESNKLEQLKRSLKANIDFKREKIDALKLKIEHEEPTVTQLAFLSAEIAVLGAEKIGYENSLKLIENYLPE